MAVTLQKGGNLSLSKTDPDMTQILVGLGWDPRVTDGAQKRPGRLFAYASKMS